MDERNQTDDPTHTLERADANASAQEGMTKRKTKHPTVALEASARRTQAEDREESKNEHLTTQRQQQQPVVSPSPRRDDRRRDEQGMRMQTRR
ncbi:hypothetical protein EYR40_007183 [Pleurotus pulmonarius]|nr:hypothetical protein EYR40_007181 [Pleurotus pulmonarius]KAF4600077.1 hypothetical protein EYR40_007183 [Pleurotus pulmonarius]